MTLYCSIARPYSSCRGTRSGVDGVMIPWATGEADRVGVEILYLVNVGRAEAGS